jgi:hypothetical protein
VAEKTSLELPAADCEKTLHGWIFIQSSYGILLYKYV